MSYTYGMRGAPAVGGGLPGLPLRGESGGGLQRSSFTRIVTPGSGTITPPEAAKYMRVAVVGGGRFGDGGAGGGGCAASIIVPAAACVYTLLPASSSGSPAGGDNVVSFAGRTLIGRGAPLGSSGNRPGGIGEGGDYNFRGGNSVRGSGFSATPGGGAGPGGPGGDGVDIPVSGSTTILGLVAAVQNPDWPVQGGQSGNFARNNSTNTVSVTSGGSGAGALAQAVLASDSITTASTVWTGGWASAREVEFGQQVPGILSLANSAGGSFNGAGGDFGGGGAPGQAGGVGGIHVDWFY